jgi:hypothetical protein
MSNHLKHALALILLATAPAIAEVPGALVTLEVTGPLPNGFVASALPPRFVLLEDGQVFVGGTSQMAAGRLDKTEARDIEQRLALVRKLPGQGAAIAFGDAATPRFRLQSAKNKLDLVVTGDLASAPAVLQSLAAFLRFLAGFDHPSLRPYEPASFAVSAREAPLVGGCRSWRLPVPLAEALSGPRAVGASDAFDWPSGAVPAAVCDGERRFVVTLRPLLPGERP